MYENIPPLRNQILYGLCGVQNLLWDSQNILKQYFQCICRCPDPLEDLSWIYLVICRGESLVPVLIWIQDVHPGLYTCGNGGNDENKWQVFIGDFREFIWAFEINFVNINWLKLLNNIPCLSTILGCSPSLLTLMLTQKFSRLYLDIEFKSIVFVLTSGGIICM